MATATVPVEAVKDFSTYPQPVGDQLFSHVTDPGDWDSFQLSSSQVEAFWSDGFISNVPLLTSEQCDRLLNDYKYFIDPACVHAGMGLLYEYHRNQTNDPNNVLMHCLGHWRVTELFHDLVFHPKVTVACSSLLSQGERRAVRFWHDQLFAKPPHHGGNVAWHQDYSYWTRTKPCMHVTVHIALDDQTLENGGLQYIKGSHRWNRNGKPLPITDFNFKDMDSIKTVLTESEQAAFVPVPSLLRKGEASFHHAMTVHGSAPNRSDQPRRAAVLNYFADGVVFSPDGQNDVGHPLWTPKSQDEAEPEQMKPARMKPGAKMDGQFFPLVFDPKWTVRAG